MRQKMTSVVLAPGRVQGLRARAGVLRGWTLQGTALDRPA
jgi:hypothetical protein